MSRSDAAILMILVLIGALISIFALRTRDRADWALCEPMYRAAVTQADTLRVDLQPAPRQRGRGQDSPEPTCGELRRLSGTTR